MTYSRPIILASRCLGFDECRYDGQGINAPFVEKLQPFVTYKTVCPEADIGMGTPRPVVRLVGADDTRMIQPSTGTDFTESMNEYSEKVSNNMQVDGVILKSGSPSCGLNAKVFAAAKNSPCLKRRPGLFANKIVENHGDSIAIEDEGRLLNASIRHHFLVRIFALAALRELEGQSNFAIESFHRRHKHLLLLFSQPRMRELGRIVGTKMTSNEKYAAYEKLFREAMLQRPKRSSHRNVLEHLAGHFKKELTTAEKAQFQTLLEDVDEQRAPLFAPLSIIKSWVQRFEYAYLKDQVYLSPYPKELLFMRDSGKGFEF